MALARALTSSARVLHASTDVEGTLEAIARAAAELVPGFEHVGVSVLDRDGSLVTLAATSDVVRELDDLQYASDQGPCLEAVRGGQVVLTTDARHDQRWPRYVGAAVRRGLRAQLGIRLHDAGETLGGLNLYSLRPTEVGGQQVETAELFAVHAAIALRRTRYERQLDDALATRKVIGQAIGLVMERYGIHEDRAFEFLARLSSTTNRKLRVVAEELVGAANRRAEGSAEPAGWADGPGGADRTGGPAAT